MIPRELFISTIEKIQKQDKRVDQFSKALNEMCDGYASFDKDNLYQEALLDLLRHGMEDQYDNIRWWLYEAPDCSYEVTWTENGKEIVVDLREVNDLYNYLVSSAAEARGESFMETWQSMKQNTT